ncbi:kinase-like protein, partial [Rozella allomycis CSF55]
LLKNSPYVAPIVQPCQSQNAFVTEYSKSESLYDRLKLIQSNTALMDRDEQIRLLSKAILAFEDMYRAKIVHNDIKDRNVLWDGKDFNLIDFGLAESWDNGKWNDVAMHYPCNEYGGNKDWIALGVMMYQVHAWNSIDAKKRSQLAIKRAYLLPYTVNFEIRKHENLCSNGQLDEIEKPSYMDQDFFDVLKLLLQKKQSLRPGYNDESIEKLKRMPLFKNYLY